MLKIVIVLKLALHQVIDSKHASNTKVNSVKPSHSPHWRLSPPNAQMHHASNWHIKRTWNTQIQLNQPLAIYESPKTHKFVQSFVIGFAAFVLTLHAPCRIRLCDIYEPCRCVCDIYIFIYCFFFIFFHLYLCFFVLSFSGYVCEWFWT